MLLRKQTVWLLTMLAVMVVLSGYYLVKGPNQQIPALTDKSKQEAPLMGVEVNTEQTDLPSEEATPVEGQVPTIETPAATESNVGASTLPETASDYFQGYRMKREAMLQQQKDEQMEIMTDGEATPQAIAEAKAKHEELSNLESKTLAMEELLKAKGYKEAIVYVQDKNVDVIVQKDKLQAQEVVEIIALAKQHFKVSGSNVTVRFKQ